MTAASSPSGRMKRELLSVTHRSTPANTPCLPPHDECRLTRGEGREREREREETERRSHHQQSNKRGLADATEEQREQERQKRRRQITSLHLQSLLLLADHGAAQKGSALNKLSARFDATSTGRQSRQTLQSLDAGAGGSGQLSERGCTTATRVIAHLHCRAERIKSENK